MHVLIVDDETAILGKLSEALRDAYTDITIDAFTSPPEDLSATDNIDVMFIDLIIDRQNGLNTAIKLSKHYPRAKIVFISNHNDLIFNVQELDALCFIRKDHFTNDFNIFKRLYQRYQESNKPLTFTLEPSNHFIIINSNDIVSVEACNHKSTIKTIDDVFVVNCTLKEFAEQTSSLNNFIQVHRSYIINMKYVHSFNADTIYMIDQSRQNEVFLSRRYRQNFINRFKEYIAL